MQLTLDTSLTASLFHPSLQQFVYAIRLLFSMQLDLNPLVAFSVVQCLYFIEGSDWSVKDTSLLICEFLE